MTKLEITKLLTLIAAIDNRNIDEVTVEMWHRVLNGYTYDEAARAVPAFFAEQDGYLAPRGLIAQMGKLKQVAAEGVHHEVLQLESEGWGSDPQPLCRAHDVPVTRCLPCCLVFGGLSEYESDVWWSSNTYVGGVALS